MCSHSVRCADRRTWPCFASPHCTHTQRCTGAKCHLLTYLFSYRRLTAFGCLTNNAMTQAVQIFVTRFQCNLQVHTRGQCLSSSFEKLLNIITFLGFVCSNIAPLHHLHSSTPTFTNPSESHHYCVS